MLKIRLQRVGRKHDPSFRVVVTDSRFAAQSGKALEVLGSYNPRFDNPTLKEDRIKEWIGKGAQVSDTVHNILVGAGIIKGKKVNALPKKVAPVKEVEAEAPAETSAPEVAPEAEAPAEEVKEEAVPAPEEAKEETAPEAVPEAPAEEKTEDAPAEEAPAEDVPAEEEKKEA